MQIRYVDYIIAFIDVHEMFVIFYKNLQVALETTNVRNLLLILSFTFD